MTARIAVIGCGTSGSHYARQLILSGALRTMASTEISITTDPGTVATTDMYWELNCYATDVECNIEREPASWRHTYDASDGFLPKLAGKCGRRDYPRVNSKQCRSANIAVGWR